MVSIYFFHKIFATTTIFMIILTSVPATLSISLSKKRMLYQMVMNENKHRSYSEYLTDTLDKNEIKMEIEDYYHTIHNLQHIRVPLPSGVYNYDAYKLELTEYCNTKYVTFERFRRDNEVRVLQNGIFSLKNRIDDILRLRSTRGIIIKTELEKKMKEALHWNTNETNKWSKILVDNAQNIQKCLSNKYEDGDKIEYGSNRKTSFVDCLEYDYEENDKSKKYAKHLLKLLKKEIDPKEYDALITIIKSFKRSFTDISPAEKDNITLRDLYLVLAIIYHRNYIWYNIDMSKLYQNYTGIQEIKITQEDREKCHDQLNKMSVSTYTATKLSYMMLPRLLELYPLAVYKRTTNLIINYLWRFDHQKNYGYYAKIKNNTEKITESYYKRMKMRRVLKNEDYTFYVMRMNIRGYLPLPDVLWNKEIEILHTNDMQQMAEKEFMNDLKNC